MDIFEKKGVSIYARKEPSESGLVTVQMAAQGEGEDHLTHIQDGEKLDCTRLVQLMMRRDGSLDTQLEQPEDTPEKVYQHNIKFHLHIRNMG